MTGHCWSLNNAISSGQMIRWFAFMLLSCVLTTFTRYETVMDFLNVKSNYGESLGKQRGARGQEYRGRKEAGFSRYNTITLKGLF